MLQTSLGRRMDCLAKLLSKVGMHCSSARRKIEPQNLTLMHAKPAHTGCVLADSCSERLLPNEALSEPWPLQSSHMHALSRCAELLAWLELAGLALQLLIPCIYRKPCTAVSPAHMHRCC